MDDAERRQEISGRIARLRKRRGLTQPQVAERMGMASKLRTYQNWEAGGGTSHENYERLAEILGVSYDYLVTGAESSPPAGDILARLDRIEANLAAVMDHLGVERAPIEADSVDESHAEDPARIAEEAAAAERLPPTHRRSA